MEEGTENLGTREISVWIFPKEHPHWDGTREKISVN
jgi:hypothetical protein